MQPPAFIAFLFLTRRHNRPPPSAIRRPSSVLRPLSSVRPRYSSCATLRPPPSAVCALAYRLKLTAYSFPALSPPPSAL